MIIQNNASKMNMARISPLYPILVGLHSQNILKNGCGREDFVNQSSAKSLDTVAGINREMDIGYSPTKVYWL